MATLTPRCVSNRNGVSLLHIIGLSRHSAPKHPMDGGIPLHSVAGSGTPRSLRLRLRHSYAGSPVHQAETGSSSCGLSVCFMLLSTPHYCDAVTFNYRLSNFSRTGLSPASPMCSKAHVGAVRDRARCVRWVLEDLSRRRGDLRRSRKCFRYFRKKRSGNFLDQPSPTVSSIAQRATVEASAWHAGWTGSTRMQSR